MLPILADHPRFLLIDKPAGLPCQREGEGDSVLDRLRAQKPGEALHLVHRLDKLTSGLLLVARGADAATELGALFAGRDIAKYYLALSDRPPKKKQGLVSGDMDKGRNGSWKLLPTRTDPAITRFFSTGLGQGRRLFAVRPHTGRTHQIRVALKAIGSPILGDARYGGTAADRGYLHAYALAFTLGGEDFRFVCPPSQGEHWPDLATHLDYAAPWQLPWP